MPVGGTGPASARVPAGSSPEGAVDRHRRLPARCPGARRCTQSPSLDAHRRIRTGHSCPASGTNRIGNRQRPRLEHDPHRRLASPAPCRQQRGLHPQVQMGGCVHAVAAGQAGQPFSMCHQLAVNQPASGTRELDSRPRKAGFHLKAGPGWGWGRTPSFLARVC
jgi:hypothetical protein